MDNKDNSYGQISTVGVSAQRVPKIILKLLRMGM